MSSTTPGPGGCTILITDVVGLGVSGGIPAQLRISGTAFGCPPNPATGVVEVVVSSNCHGGPTTVPVDAAGHWTVDVPNRERCPCLTDFRPHIVWVRVACAGDPSCEIEDRRAIRCDDKTTMPPTTTQPPAACHQITGSHTPVPCSAGGASVNVTFTASITPASPPYTGVVDWEVTDQTGNTVAATSGGPVQTFALPGPDTYTITATIVRPGCQPLTRTWGVTVHVPSCSCPTFAGGISATQDPNDPCVWHFSAAVSNPGGAAVSYDWDFDVGSAPPNQATTSSPQASATYVNAGAKTVRLTLTSGSCTDTVEVSIAVSCGQTTQPPPTTSTTPPPTPTTTTTTRPPTGSTTTTARPTTTTRGPTAPPTPPPNGGMGCLCLALLIAAIAALGTAAIALLAWGCAGAMPALLGGALVAAAVAVVLFAVWVVLCRACPEIGLLKRLLLMLAGAMLIGAIIFALIGLLGCALGALLVALLFLAVAGLLHALGAAIGCP